MTYGLPKEKTRSFLGRRQEELRKSEEDLRAQLEKL
jgi:hypothetical protein